MSDLELVLTEESSLLIEVSGLNFPLTVNDIAGLPEALAEAANDDLEIVQTAIANLNQALTNKANINHTHTIAQIGGLSDLLSNIQNNIDSKAATNHSHPDLQTAIDQKINSSEKGQPNGIATLGSDGLVPASQSRGSSIVYNSANGIITFTDARGNQTQIDLPIENLFQSANYNSSTKNLTLTTNGGGTIDVPLTDLVDLPEIAIATANPGTTPSTGQKLWVRSDTGEYWIASNGAWTMGSRTADDTQTPTSLTGTVTQWLGWIANRIKAITGKPNWFDAPAMTLEAISTRLSQLGSLSNQNSNNVTITGGSINGVAIGAETASTLRGTTLKLTSTANSLDGAAPGTSGALQLAGGLSAVGNMVAGGYIAAKGNLYVDATGSSPTAPKIFGVVNMGEGTAAAFQFGSTANQLFSGNGLCTSVTSWYGIDLFGARWQLGGTEPPKNSNLQYCLGVWDTGGGVTNLLLQPLAGVTKTSNFLEIRSAANNLLTQFDSNGKLSVFDTTPSTLSTNGAVVVSGGLGAGNATIGGSFRHTGSLLGFYNAPAITRPSITGSRGGNEAISSLLTQLANLGLISDSTTA